MSLIIYLYRTTTEKKIHRNLISSISSLSCIHLFTMDLINFQQDSFFVLSLIPSLEYQFSPIQNRKIQLSSIEHKVIGFLLISHDHQHLFSFLITSMRTQLSVLKKKRPCLRSGKPTTTCHVHYNHLMNLNDFFLLQDPKKKREEEEELDEQKTVSVNIVIRFCYYCHFLFFLLFCHQKKFLVYRN